MDSSLLQQLLDFVWPLIEGNKFAVVLLSVIGFMRIVFKPLFGILKSFTNFTPYDKDDEWVAKIEQSKVYQSLAWVADLLSSVKLPKAKKKN